MAAWDDVRRLGLALEGAEESTSYRQPALKVRGCAFAALSPHEPGALVTWVDAEEALLLVSALPSVHFTTPHYTGYDVVLTRLDAVDEDELAGRLEDSWAFVSKRARRPRRRR